MSPSAADEAESLFEVERIAARRRRNGADEYLIKWSGYPAGESTWEPRANLCNIPDMVRAFDAEWRRQGVKRPPPKGSPPKPSTKRKTMHTKTRGRPPAPNSARALRKLDTPLETHSPSETGLSLPYNLLFNPAPERDKVEEGSPCHTPETKALSAKDSRIEVIVCNPHIQSHIFVEGKLFLLISLRDDVEEKMYVSQALFRERWPEELCFYYERFIKIT